VFLFDEPLSNLDAELRVDMRVEIARLHKDIGATMIYVTHDQVEAMTLADKIVVLRGGIIEQVGTPMQLYSDPDNRFVAGFIGSPAMNFVEGTAGEGSVSIPAFGGTEVPTSVALPAAGKKVLVGLRPQHLKVSPAADGARVDLCEQLGGVAYSYLVCPTGERVIVETKGEDAPVSEGTVAIGFEAGAALYFDAGTEERLR
jgi:lactose/L-arabinose transport system ATP-binding protein